MNVVRYAWVVISHGLKRYDSAMVLMSRCSPSYEGSEFRVNNDTRILAEVIGAYVSFTH